MMLKTNPMKKINTPTKEAAATTKKYSSLPVTFILFNKLSSNY